MTSSADDQIEEARKGDAAVLGHLLESYRNYLRVLARIEIGRLLQGKVDASDVIQETFLDAHRHIGSFRGTTEAQFLNWLREILAGTIANTVRRYFGTQGRDIRLEQSLLADINQSSHAFGQIPVDPHSSPSRA
mgnify:CR=1 FL=1